MSGKSQTSTINSEQRTIGNLLGDKRFLKVPAYQRSFSWTKNEVSDLWDDLQGILYGDEDNYFLGSMVFISKPEGSLEVVDGQQRLATVSLLLSTIRDGFQGIAEKHRCQAYTVDRNVSMMYRDYLNFKNHRSCNGQTITN